MSLAPPTRPDHPIPSHPQREHGAQTRRAGRTAVSSRPPGMRIRRPSRCGSRPLVSASRKQICFLSSDALLISSPCDPPARSVCAPSPAADRLAHGEDQQVLRPLQDQSHRRRSTGTSLLRPPSPALLRSQAAPPRRRLACPRLVARQPDAPTPGVGSAIAHPCADPPGSVYDAEHPRRAGHLRTHPRAGARGGARWTRSDGR